MAADIIDARPVVIFGAGEAGRRAMAWCRRDPATRVIAIADNAAERQGTVLEGLPVIGAMEIAASGAERVIVASQAWPQIVRQLRSLGMSSGRLDIYRVGEDTVTPAFPKHDYPAVLVLTDECIAPSHGTGAVLLRHFASYPRNRLLHGYLQLKGDVFLPHSFKVAPASAIAPAAPGTAEKPTLSAAQLVEELESTHGPIELVYSNFFGETGLTFLAELLEVLGPNVPVIHHVHDLIVRDDARFASLLRTVAPRVSDFWAIGPGLAERVSQATGRDVALMNTFSCPIAPVFKRQHRDVDESFTAVMLGNSHIPYVLDRLREAWSEVRRRYGVGPIRWFAYPTSVLTVERAGVRVDPDIEYYGYLSDRVLHEHLCSADLALVPFNVTDEPEYGYARYSIPSRLTELVNAGLPVFAAAGRHTEARRFMEHHGIGRCSTIADSDGFVRELLDFVSDTAARRDAGARARSFAERNCNVDRYRARLMTRIGSLTGYDLEGAGAGPGSPQ